MFAKRSLRCCRYVIIFVSLLCWSSSAIAITIDELADICQAMEEAILDITVEYAFSVDPPPKKQNGLIIGIGPKKYKWSAAKPLTELSKSSCDFSVMDENENAWDVYISQAYNGKVAKKYQLDGWPNRSSEGIITNKRNFKPIKSSTPLAYTVHHFAGQYFSLSQLLREKEKVTVVLDNEIRTVNNFDAICVDIYGHSKEKKVLAQRVFFSPKHNFTPVKIEYFNGRTTSVEFNVLELEEVKEGIWFPIKGCSISSRPNTPQNIYQASKVILNQGLTYKDFDIEFPPGTRVVDEISGTSYIFHPTEGKSNQKPTNEPSPCCAMNEDRTGVAAQSEVVDTNSVEAILKQLKEKTTKIKSYQAQLEYRFSQPLLESETLRKGVLYYQRFDGKSVLRVNFQTLKQDDEKEQKHIEHFIFDGIWLTHIDYQIKAVKRHQLAEPNEPVDAFDLASRNLPIIGFTKIEDLKKQFEIKLVEQKKESPPVIPAEPVPSEVEGAGTHEPFHLNLKTKPDPIYKDDYTSIDFWIDRNLGLPAKVVAVSTEEDIYEIKFLKPKLNETIDKKVFEFEIPKGFTMEIIPLKKKE